MAPVDELFDKVVHGRAPETRQIVEAALSDGVSLDDVVATMNSAMEEVGLRFSRNEIFLPEMMVAARAMKAGMELIEPLIIGRSVATKGKILIGTITGDLHDIGKNLVGMMFRGAGFEVVDIGVDVTKEAFLEGIKRKSPEIVGICALLTTVLTDLAETAAFLRAASADHGFKIMVGGAAVDADYARRIGADGYADDAGEAVQVAKRLLENTD
jgi:5-methyltetrahydrofolate--homocysteine methyltransferase